MQQKYAVIIDRRHPMAGDTVAIERFTELGAEGSIIQPDLSVQETTLSSDQYEMVTHLLTDFWLKVGDRSFRRRIGLQYLFNVHFCPFSFAHKFALVASVAKKE